VFSLLLSLLSLLLFRVDMCVSIITGEHSEFLVLVAIDTRRFQSRRTTQSLFLFLVLGFWFCFILTKALKTLILRRRVFWIGLGWVGLFFYISYHITTLLYGSKRCSMAFLRMFATLLLLRFTSPSLLIPPLLLLVCGSGAGVYFLVRWRLLLV
jgi:hypothetical protein